MNRSLVFKIWLFSILIMIFGLIGLYSATFNNVRVPQKIFYDQMIFSLIAILIMWGLSNTDYRKFYDFAYIVYGGNVLFLVLVLLSGRNALGATRWFEVAGFSFQPSEFMKLSLILALGRYYSSRSSNYMFGFYGRIMYVVQFIIVPFLLTAVPMYLIFKQPDLGTAILLFGIFFAMLFINGISYRFIFGFMGLCVLVTPVLWMMMKDYQKARLLVFLNPNIDPLGSGYTIIQSKIAVGSGQIFGKGWFAGTQNQLNFLPERHTDFIFSVIGEEWGFIGCVFMIGCFYMLVRAGLSIAEKVTDKFGVNVTVGIASILALQVVINVGMVMGMFPIVGITLPLVSYGRTSFLTTAIMLGFLLNLSRKRTFAG
ncbi:MAG: rod shape-determining protein RodA [Candidatus Omnitrophica bacterium]|nr:rod shape-determining protein RodA [Candidatus Omnitrophota bacterium]